MSHRIETAVVGSYPQPDWLVDRDRLGSQSPPRVRAAEIWRVAEPNLEAAQDDATRLAVQEMERAGVDIISDGEIRRESYSNRLATMLDGMELDPPGEVIGRTGATTCVPRVVGPIGRPGPILVRDMEVLRACTRRTTKFTLPGPFTMAMQAQNEYYPDEESLAMALAEVVNAEVKALFAAGADIVQLDEPWMQARPEQARSFAVTAINKALEGAPGPCAVHMCFGYAQSVKDKPSGYSFLPELDGCAADIISIEAAQPKLDLSILEALPSKRVMVGVIAMDDATPESADRVAAQLRDALRHVSPQRLIAAPDCGMKYLPRESAYAKLRAMVAGAEAVSREL